METQLEILESEALKLTPSERAALAQRCIAEVESGAVQVVPIAEALAQVRAKLK